jgi:hypothetical protein
VALYNQILTAVYGNDSLWNAAQHSPLRCASGMPRLAGTTCTPAPSNRGHGMAKCGSFTIERFPCNMRRASTDREGWEVIFDISDENWRDIIYLFYFNLLPYKVPNDLGDQAASCHLAQL